MEATRRDFLKSSAAIAVVMGGVGISSTGLAAVPSFPGVIYTKEHPGRWSKIVIGHSPVINQLGRNVTITTKHPMAEVHFIVRHTLVLADGTVAGSKTFSPADEKPISVLKLPEGYSGKFYATSFCNKHDMWVVEGMS